MTSLRVAAAVAAKDLRAELRAREALVSMAVFGLLALVTFNFAFDAASDEARRIAPGLVWIAFTLASLLGLNRSFALEREGGAVQALLLAPVDRGAVYLGKMAANAVLLLVLEAIVFPLLAVLYNLPLAHAAPRIALVGALGAWALASAGTIFAAVSASTRMREVMTPLLLLPAATPVVVAAVEGTTLALAPDGTRAWSGAVRLLAGFSVIYTAASYLLFEHVLED